MENAKNRVLAYTLAKTIDSNDLAKVSGGNDDAGLKLSNKQSVYPSGSSAEGLDVRCDVSVDW
jgi:hypothetical protein